LLYEINVAEAEIQENTKESHSSSVLSGARNKIMNKTKQVPRILASRTGNSSIATELGLITALKLKRNVSKRHNLGAGTVTMQGKSGPREGTTV
jgi:hypothetical protein